MPEEIKNADTVGSVSSSRYEQIVAELRTVVENQTRGQFTIGDYALEIASRYRSRCSAWPRTSDCRTRR